MAIAKRRSLSAASAFAQSFNDIELRSSLERPGKIAAFKHLIDEWFVTGGGEVLQNPQCHLARRAMDAPRNYFAVFVIHAEMVAEFVQKFAREFARQWWKDVQPLLVNEDAIGPAINPFQELFYKQFGGSPKVG